MTFLPGLNSGPTLTWDPTTLTAETITLVPNTIYAWNNSVAAVNGTFPANPVDGDEILIKEVDGGGFNIFFLTPGSGHSVELPDGSVITSPNQSGIEGAGLICGWKFRAATNRWHIHPSAHAENAAAITVGVP